MALYLVTGGCGFIGSHVALSLLAAGHSVRILDDLSSGRRALAPAAADLHIGSITDPSAVARAVDGVDGCFHLAAIASVIRSIEDWSETHGVNLGGTVRVFEAAAAHGVPVVYASSAAAYGEPAMLPVDEDSQTRPLTAYGADKLGCEVQARVGGMTRGLKSFGLRFFNVFGPNQDPSSPYSGVIAIFADRVGAGLPIVIYGDGEQTRDFVYVSDVVRYLTAALRLATAEAPICNVCRGQPVTVRALAEAVMEVCGRHVAVHHEEARPGEIRHSLGSTARAERLFGFSAQVGLVDGLRLLLGAVPERADGS
jgi:UDP-glucose 4-epimerase